MRKVPRREEERPGLVPGRNCDDLDVLIPSALMPEVATYVFIASEVRYPVERGMLVLAKQLCTLL